MQRLEVSGAVRLIYKSLGVKGLTTFCYQVTWFKKSLTARHTVLIYSHVSLNDGDAFWEKRRYANVTECAYTNLDSIAYHTPGLYGIAYCSQATNLYSMLLYWWL